MIFYRKARDARIRREVAREIAARVRSGEFVPLARWRVPADIIAAEIERAYRT